MSKSMVTQRMKKSNKYWVSSISGRSWEIIHGPSGIPVYDDDRYGNAKPVIFKDYDDAVECARNYNIGLEQLKKVNNEI